MEPEVEPKAESISGEPAQETSSLEDAQSILTDSASPVNEGSRLSECGCSYDCLPSLQMTSTIKTPQLSPPVPAIRNYEPDSMMKHSFADQDSASAPLQTSGSKGKMQTGKIEGAVNVEDVVNNEKEVANSGKIQTESAEDSGAESRPTKSIYLDDGNKKKHKVERNPPQRRLTKAQLAAMDALASFGGSDLGSVTFKTRDLKDKLQKETEQFESLDKETEDTAKRPRTRLQVAKQEADAIFKHIPLGEDVKKVPSAFTRKRARDEEGGHEMKRLTKLDKAKFEALEAFGGAPLGSLSKRQKKDQNDVLDLTKQPDPAPTGRLTRVERARLEAFHSFGGSGLGDVMGGAKKRVARTLEPKCESDNDSSKNEDFQEQNENDKENLVNQVIA